MEADSGSFPNRVRIPSFSVRVQMVPKPRRVPVGQREKEGQREKRSHPAGQGVLS